MEGKEMPPSFPALMAACFLAPLSSGVLLVFRNSLLKVPQPFDQGKAAGSFRTRRRPAPQCPSHKTGYQLKYQQHGACCLCFKPNGRASVPRGRTESKEPHCCDCRWQQVQQQSAAWHEAAGKMLPLCCRALGGPHPASWETWLMPILNLWLQVLSQHRARWSSQVFK